jgi:uncharacterized OB-fold protein
MTSGFPLPKPDALFRPFWDFAQASTLALQCCQACGDIHFPPSPVCPKCLSDKQEWNAASGRGTLFSWCEFHKSYWDSVASLLPYRVAVVRLEEGPLVISNLIDVQDEAALQLDAPVTAVFQPVSADYTVPVFRLAGASRAQGGRA